MSKFIQIEEGVWLDATKVDIFRIFHDEKYDLWKARAEMINGDFLILKIHKLKEEVSKYLEELIENIHNDH